MFLYSQNFKEDYGLVLVSNIVFSVPVSIILLVSIYRFSTLPLDQTKTFLVTIAFSFFVLFLGSLIFLYFLSQDAAIVLNLSVIFFNSLFLSLSWLVEPPEYEVIRSHLVERMKILKEKTQNLELKLVIERFLSPGTIEKNLFTNLKKALEDNLDLEELADLSYLLNKENIVLLDLIRNKTL